MEVVPVVRDRLGSARLAALAALAKLGSTALPALVAVAVVGLRAGLHLTEGVPVKDHHIHRRPAL